MASALTPQVFSFQDHNIRTTGTDRDLWFVAKDACESLEIAWSGATLKPIPDEWRGMMKFNIPRRNPDGTTSFQQQTLAVINEQAFYLLAFRSNKDAAVAFQRWVAGEVLPAIRKTGEYRVKRRERYQRLGKTEEWIEQRQEGIEERKTFAATLQAHECNDYAGATNAIYKPVLGGTAAQAKMAMQLKPKASVRDSLSTHDLMRVKFAEMMAADRIERDDLRGDPKCLAASRVAGQAVATAMQIARETPIP